MNKNEECEFEFDNYCQTILLNGEEMSLEDFCKLLLDETIEVIKFKGFIVKVKE